jgi:DNA-binding CsgD family transcriptional regulator
MVSLTDNKINLKQFDILSKLKAHLSRKIKDLDLKDTLTIDFTKKFDLRPNDKTKHMNTNALNPYNHSFHIDNNTFELSKREWECWRLIALGQTAKTIGNQLDISQRTAEHYINVLKQKTALPNKADLATEFYRQFKEWL